MFKVKIFRGNHPSTKIFYLDFFINEIFSVEKFPNYGILTQLLSARGALQEIQELFFLTKPDSPPTDGVVTVLDRV